MSNAHVIEDSGVPPGWARPPWPHHEARARPGAQACTIDTVDGQCWQSFVLDVNPQARDWLVGAKAEGPFVFLAVARVARITLAEPLNASKLAVDSDVMQSPKGTLECDYIVRTAAGRELLHGRTVGHVDTNDGVFLFTALAGEVAFNRVLIPRATHLSCEFGPIAVRHDASQWITEPAALRAALASQRCKRIPLIGEALAQLGFVTAPVIEQALGPTALPGRLGERLVLQGLITPEQLQTGLAFKLGYPLVDLARFPIDPACARMLSPELARRHCAVPILLDGRQVVVAVDGPATFASLEAMNLWRDKIIAPVCAPRGAILLALSKHCGNDAWSQEAPWR